MTLIEKMKRYIRDTGCEESCDRYMLRFDEMQVLENLDPFDAVSLSFEYGRAKGYRAAHKEAGKP